MTKAQEVYEKVEALIATGTPKSEAFKQLAGEYGQPVNSIRGSYYQHKRPGNGESGPKPRRRETTPEDAMADARAALTRAIASIDREVEVAKGRADEAKAEYDSLRASASGRKAAITAKLETLK
ncbi:MAG: hypothetical protein M3065_08670 [Actinomycetota bacterium]|nr:hypothetical protein [Actinomycetota bacterium]